MNDATWTTKDGRTLLVREMATSHLYNTIQFLRRKALRHLMRRQVGGVLHGLSINLFDEAWDHIFEECPDPTQEDADELLLREADAFPAMVVEFDRRLHPCGDEHWSG